MFWKNSIACLVLFGILLLNSNNAAADSFDYVDLDELVATSDVVIHVKIPKQQKLMIVWALLTRLIFLPFLKVTI